MKMAWTGSANWHTTDSYLGVVQPYFMVGRTVFDVAQGMLVLAPLCNWTLESAASVRELFICK